MLQETAAPEKVEIPTLQAPPEHERSTHGDVSRTWELEMLISGAVFFALLQLPSAVDARYDQLGPHLSSGLGMLVMMGWLYTKAGLYAMIACLLVHLVARAYWVGLIGLDSVFPGGIRWENGSQGPNVQAVYRERLSSLASVIDRTDNFCSVLFSFAFLLVLMFVYSIAMVTLLLGLGFGISRLVLGRELSVRTFYVIVAAFIFPPLLPQLLDRWIGKRLDPESGLARMIRGSARVSYRLMLFGVYGPIMMTLFSNIRRKVIIPVFYVMFFGVMALVLGGLYVRQGILSMSSYEFLPAEPDAHSVDFRFYESQRPEGEVFERIPSIQSDVIGDPYVKLFIPYAPVRHNPALERSCPGAKPLSPGGVRFSIRNDPPGERAETAVLRCLAEMHRVTLDGKPLAAPAFEFYTHPRTGLRGIITYIPTEGLPRGRHVLTVMQAPRASIGGMKLSNLPRQMPYVIPFWI